MKQYRESPSKFPRFVFQRKSPLTFVLNVVGLALAAAAGVFAGDARAQDEIKYAFAVSSPSLITEALHHAEKEGYFAREGLKVHVTWLQGDGLALRSVISGEHDVAWLGTTAAIQAISKGAKVKIIYGPVPLSSNVIMSKKEIGSLADLKAKSIAVSAVGAISYHIPRIMLLRAGVDPSTAEYVPLGSTATRYQALIAGKVDAGMVDLIQAIETQDRYPRLHSLASVAEKVPDLHFISVIASEKALKEKPQALAKLFRAELAGLKFAVEQPERAAELSRERIKVSEPSYLARAFKAAADAKIYGLDGGLDRALLGKTVNLMVEMGDLQAAVSVDQIVDRSVIEAK